MIRPCRPDEIDAVLSLWATDRSPVAATEDRREDVARLVQSGALLIAEHGDEVVGTLVAAFDGWRGNMYRLAVHPDHRRRGLARALVAHGEERLRGEGARRVTALVGADDEPATALWRAAGYEHNPHIARYVRNI